MPDTTPPTPASRVPGTAPAPSVGSVPGSVPDTVPETVPAGPARGRLEPWAVLAGAYGLQACIAVVLRERVPGIPLLQPFPGLPLFVFDGWDGEHYLRLSEHFDTWAWPPLYPLALRALRLGLGPHQAAVLLNLAAHAAIVPLAYALVRHSPQLARVPPWLFALLLLFFPGHNVFFAVYSESLFLALALGAAVAWRRDRLLVAGVLCGLALLTRNMGTFLGAGLLGAELWRAFRAFRARHLDVGRLLASAAWVPFLVGWNLWLRLVAHTDPVAATAFWQEELLRVHVPPGASPRLWVLAYLALPGHPQWLFFWAAVAAGVWCWRAGLRLEALYVAAFLASHALYLYRPFPFTRYVSVLYPVTLAAACALRRPGPLPAVAVAVAAVLSAHTTALLFLHRIGEP